jgi:glutamate synthase (NADPH/NADH) small chain
MEDSFSMDQALREAARCLLCHDAPCSAACPAYTEPDRFIRKLRFKNIKGAAALVNKNNLFGGVCGAICPTSRLCEEGCLASGIGSPIAIGKIQKFLVEYGWQVGLEPIRAKPSNGRRVAVVGAGPSGLTCAGELARAGYQVVVFERLSTPGGMLTHVIPEHRLSRELVAREIAEIVRLGVEIKCDCAIETRADIDGLLASGFEAVYLAHGAWKCGLYDAPKPASDDVCDALWFLKYAREQAFEFTSFVRDQEILVIGGGDSALDAAVTALRYGARDAYVIYRRSYVEMPASRESKDEALSAGVHLLFLTEPVSYSFKGGKLAGVRVVRCRLGEKDGPGRRDYLRIDGTEHTIPADLIVEAGGLLPEHWPAGLSGIDVEVFRHIEVDPDSGQTSAAKIFAGGDATSGAQLVARAVGDGKRAARGIQRALERSG